MPLRQLIPWFGRKSAFTAPSQASARSGPLFDIVYPAEDQSHAKFSSTVMAAVWWGARNLRQGVPEVQEKKASGWEAVAPHQLADLLRAPQALIKPELRTNMTGPGVMAALMYSATLDGNMFLLKVRDGAGAVIGLDWLPPYAVRVKSAPDNDALVTHYEVKTGRSYWRPVRREDMVHAGVVPDPDRPCTFLSPLKSLMRHVMSDNHIAVYIESISRSPAARKLITPTADSVNNFDPDEALKHIKSATTGERASTVAAFNMPMEVTDLSLKPDEMAITELNRIPEERICAVLGVPPIVLQLGSGERSKYNNMKEAREAAAEEFLVPFWDGLAAALTSQLLPDFDSAKDRRVAFDLSGVRPLSEDEDRKHQRARDDFAANLISRATALRMIGEDPAPGDEDVYAWMLRPAPAAPWSLPQGPDAGKAARTLAEGR